MMPSRIYTNTVNAALKGPCFTVVFPVASSSVTASTPDARPTSEPRITAFSDRPLARNPNRPGLANKLPTKPRTPDADWLAQAGLAGTFALLCTYRNALRRTSSMVFTILTVFIAASAS